MSAPPTPCLVGPTGSGKSDVGEYLARKTQGEVISCDAFAVYRGMEILSAAPHAAAEVPTHLVGDRPPSEAITAAAFQAACDTLVDDIRSRGRVPWIVGGSALYLRCWLKGFGAPATRDPDYRLALDRLAADQGSAHLHGLLAAVDPERAADLHPHDQRRVTRALEIIRATGRPASAQREQWTGPDRRPAALYGLRRPFDDLEERIRRRTRAMFEAGVVAEAAALRTRPLAPEATKALGLDLLWRLLDGEISEAQAREDIARRTRRYAKKQLTFFGSFDGLTWIDVAADDEAETVAQRILDVLPASVYASA